jgi:hypothetical protein
LYPKGVLRVNSGTVDRLIIALRGTSIGDLLTTKTLIATPFPGMALGDAINLLPHRAGVSGDGEGDGLRTQWRIHCPVSGALL